MTKTKKHHRALATLCDFSEAALGDRVNELVRRRYSLSEELSILRRRDEAPDAFRTYYEYVEQCKLEARAAWEVTP